MMVDRRHFEYTLVGHLEVADLDDVAHGFHDVQSAQNHRQEFGVRGDGQGCEQTTQRQEPVSPMKIDAGFELYHRKPKQATAAHTAMTVRSRGSDTA